MKIENDLFESSTKQLCDCITTNCFLMSEFFFRFFRLIRNDKSNALSIAEVLN